jgi:hypothetical protein
MAEYSMQHALKAFLDKSRLKNQVQALQIESVWEDIMGKTVSRYTEKLELVQGTLFVTTTVAPLRHELSYQKELIAGRVNEKMGEYVVHAVVIR